MPEPIGNIAPPPPPPPPPFLPRSVAASFGQYSANWNPPVPPPPPAPKPATFEGGFVGHAQPEKDDGFFGRMKSAISSGDVREVASTVRSGIGDATEAARSGVTTAVHATSEVVGKGADYARSHVTGDDLLSRGVRGAITYTEQSVRMQVGIAGGLVREGVGLVGSVGQLAVTAVELKASPEARADLVTSLGKAGSAVTRYATQIGQDPGKLRDGLTTAWEATTGAVGRKLDSYGTAIAEGRTEDIGLDVGTVASYVVPVGGGARVLGAAGRVAGEGVTRGGTTLVARTGDDIVTQVVRHAPLDASRTAANDVGAIARNAANDTGPVLRRAAGDAAPPPPAAKQAAEAVPQVRPGQQPPVHPNLTPAELHAKAQLAKHVYGEGPLPAGTRQVTDATELAKLGLDPGMLSNKAFHAEVFATGSRGAESYTIAFRGTRVTKAADWIANGQQGLGAASHHYSRALEIGKAIARTGPALDVSFVGHSLGGGLATHAANAAGRHAVTFNAAGLHANSIAEGVKVAAQHGVRQGMADNFVVPGEILTTAQEFIPFVPKAFGESHRLPLELPAGKSVLTHYGPLGPISRHSMEWILASTASRLP